MAGSPAAHALRPLIVNVRFVRNGRELFKSTAFAGFIGALTASKQGAFSLSVDTRMDAHVDTGLVKWLLSPSDTDTDLTMLTRVSFEEDSTYAAAHARLNATKIIGPAYIIVSGVEEGEGAVIAKGASGLLKQDGLTVDDWQLRDNIASGTYNLVQTNYDRWKSPPFFDNRRDPAKLCMHQLGPQAQDFTGLYNVLNAKPNLNDLTTYTTLMHAKSGRFETYRQLCTGHGCPLFVRPPASAPAPAPPPPPIFDCRKVKAKPECDQHDHLPYDKCNWCEVTAKNGSWAGCLAPWEIQQLPTGFTCDV